MRYLLLVMSLWSMSVYAQDEAYIASIELDAGHRASHYANDIRQISKSVLASEKSGDIAQFTRDVHEVIKRDEPIATHLKKVSQVLVFLSFSMPEKSLKSWLLQCKRSGATPVIRGLIHNSFRDTMRVVQALSQKTGIGMQLDPLLFKTFDIRMVPAVVYIKDIPSCPANMDCKPVDYDSLYGDVSLDYALEKMKGDDDPTLDTMIKTLRGDLI